MADFSGPIRRNHAILSKKLSNVHGFTTKSIYDDVFSTSSKLKAPNFSSRVDDYAEIFNRSSSSSASSIPVLDLPDIDKLHSSGNVPSSKSDYASIFGGFSDVDVNLSDEVSTEARIPAKASPSESDTDSLEKDRVDPNDSNEQSVDGKKEFKMSYNKINIGISKGAPGTTHIAQLHAVPGFTRIIDEICPSQTTELPLTNDVGSSPGVSELVIEQKHSRTASSNIPDSDFKDSDEKKVEAYDVDVNASRPKVMPSSSPTPNIGNTTSTSSSIKGIASKYETCESDDFESKIDESPVFSDEEVDTNSRAAASAAAVRKAIEMAQASIRLAKEAMERHKGFQNSMKYRSKKKLKVKEIRDTKMAAEVKLVRDRKGLEISEREQTTNQIFPCTNWQKEMTGNQSEVLPVKQDRPEGKGEFEAKNIHGCQEIEQKLKVSQEVEIDGKLNASQEPEIFEEVLTEFLEHAENENESTNWKSANDDYDAVLKDSQKQLETELKLKQAREGFQIENKLKEDYVGEEKERSVNELQRQEMYEREVKEACESVENENKPTTSSEEQVNKDNLQDAWTAKDYESGLESVHDQELRLYDFNGGRASDNRLEEDFEREGFEKHDRAWKQEENENAWEEAGQNDGNERADDEKNLKASQDSFTNTEKNHQETYDDNVEATPNVLSDKKSYMMLGATETSSAPEENEESLNAVEMTNELADTEMYGESSLDQDAIDGDDDQITNNVDDVPDVSMFDDDKVSETKSDENEFKVEDVEYDWEAKYMLETAASISEDEFEQSDIENSLKDQRDTILVDDSDLSLDDASEDSENETIDKNNKESGISCNVGASVENVAHEFGEPSNNIKEDGAAFDQVDVIDLMKAASVDKQCVQNEKIMEAAQEIKTSQYTEQVKDHLNETLNSEERKAKESMHEDVIVEKKQSRNRDESKEKEREIERGRLAVERAIRESRERAFADARERAEKAAMEKATAEAQQRLKKDVRERLDKAAAEANSLAAKVSREAKAKAERAAVERATEEARGRALEKALSEKATFEAREQQNSGTRRTFSSSDQHQGSGPSSSYKHSNSSSNGARSPSDRSDDGTKNESAERCKARLEKHQQIVERAAKALEEKNKRDLLAQKEQAERNRFADALDSDVKRWSSGKTGNLRALLSTLQYILGTDSGWQPILLTDIVTNSAVKKAYRKATLFVHPDKLQQRRASIQQKYICEKVFDLLKDAWNKFNSEER